MQIKDRINEFIRFKKLSIKAFEEKIGSSNGSWNKSETVSEDVLKTLGYDKESSILFLVAVDKHGYTDIENEYQLIEWNKARQAIVFLFRKSGCSIRYIDENYNIHKQYIGRKGFRICVNDWNNLELCFYRNVNLLDSRTLNSENFRQEMMGMWADYRNFIKG